jgi:hypothetical protein
MTMSRDRRLEDQAAALRTMMSDMGDEDFAHKAWDVKDPRFENLARTTWAELKEKGLIAARHQIGAEEYRLTEAGWIVGLRLTEAFTDPEFRARCIALVKYLKSAVDGRRQPTDAFIWHHDLPAAGFPVGWVLNVLKSDLLQEMFVDKRMNAYWDERGRSIRVPVTFGMPLD